VAFRRFVVAHAPLDEPDRSWATAITRQAGILSAIALAVTIPVRLVVQARGFADGDPWLPMIPRVLSTTWGHAAIWQLVAAVFTCVGLIAIAKGNPRGWYQAAFGAAVLAIVPAFMGHAVATERHTWLAVIVDITHVAAASAWAGGLAMLTLLARRARFSSAGGETTAGLIDAFHPMAQRSVVALVATGVVAAWMRLKSVSDLGTSGYGRILVVKVLLVGVALALGWRHSKTGAVQAQRFGARAVAASLAMEWLLLFAVMLVTGVLAGSDPTG
jgi:putative copper export protein